VTEPIRAIGPRSELPAVTPVQRRRPRDEEEQEPRQQGEPREQSGEAPPRRPGDPERLIDVEA
jgi:hypothetical protein